MYPPSEFLILAVGQLYARLIDCCRERARVSQPLDRRPQLPQVRFAAPPPEHGRAVPGFPSRLLNTQNKRVAERGQHHEPDSPVPRGGALAGFSLECKNLWNLLAVHASGPARQHQADHATCVQA
jgi:hypothetical protein